MTNKMTQKDYYNKLKAIDAVAADADLVAFIDSKIAQLDKRKTSGKKALTPTQKANELIKEAILFALDADEKYSVADVINKVSALNGASNQKATALLTQLIDDHKLVRTMEKRKAYYSLVA